MGAGIASVHGLLVEQVLNVGTILRSVPFRYRKVKGALSRHPGSKAKECLEAI